MSSKRSSEMERIAKESRQFREAEAKRIAAEKEETRRALELQKQQERERIALQSGQFLENAAKEQELMSRLKSMTIQQQREEKLQLEADVSEKARQLSHKEQLERRRKEDERFVLQQRELKKASSKDSEVDGLSLESFSGEIETTEDTETGQGLSRQTTVYYDAAMSQSSLEKTVQETNECKTPLKLTKSDTVYYDATPVPEETTESLDSHLADNLETPMPMEKKDEAKTTVFFDAQARLEMVTSNPDTSIFQTPMPVSSTVVESSQKTVFFDARTIKEETMATNITSPAGVQARALFSGRDDDTFPTHASTAAPINEESLTSHHTTKLFRKVHKKERPPNDEKISGFTRVQEACYEIPIEYNPTDGSFTVTRDAEISMSTSMAPSRVDGRWTGSLEGKASLGPSTDPNAAVGSVALDYAINSWSKVSLGMIRGHELYHPLVAIGGSLVQHGSVLGVTFYHNASFLHAMLLEHSMYSLSFRHMFPNTRWVFSSELSRRQDLSVALSNSKLSSRFTWSLRNPKRIAARLDIRPSLRADRTAHIFGEWKSFGAWQLGGSLVQSLHSKVATFGLGVRLFSTRGLEWILSWNRGDATVRIPVVVASGIRNVHLGQVMYFSLLSFLIQEGIAELWGWNNQVVSNSDENAAGVPTPISIAKGRQDAELQKALMSRQAKRKQREESDKDGLVIHKATYSMKGGEDWDATIPLQFWVSRSTLTLPPKSKSQLLGFYDISTLAKAKSTPPVEIATHAPGSFLWWKAIWNDLIDSSTSTLPSAKQAPGLTPTLNVRYDFKGQAYQIIIDDEQELILPNPNAKSL